MDIPERTITRVLSAPMSDIDRSTLREFRRRRRDRRLGGTEWFDVAYRVYLLAFVGTASVLWISDLLNGLIDDPTRDKILTRGPGVAGIIAAVMVAIGLRQGAEGGPVSVERGDVRIVLQSPIPRRMALFKPTFLIIRSVAFGLAVAAAALGQLIGFDVVGSQVAWAGALALFGVILGVMAVTSAVVAHVLRMTHSVAGALGVLAIGAQSASAVRTWQTSTDGQPPGLAGAGPFDLVGSIALWGVRQRSVDLFAMVFAAGLVAVALRWCGRLRIEDLERRGRLVSQLRFAAITRDIRTVVLLRRQLHAERLRPHPWFKRTPSRRPERACEPLPFRRRPPVFNGTSRWAVPLLLFRRGLASLRRFPPVRVVRVVSMATLAGMAACAAVGTSPLWSIAMVVALFVVGLDLVEPLAQEIDHPDRTGGLPIERGRLYAWLLSGPALGAAVVGVIGTVVVTLLDPEYGPAATALSIPVAWAGVSGSVVSTIRDAPRLAIVDGTTALGAAGTADQPIAVLNVGGFGSAMSAVFPFACSAVAAVPVLVIRNDPSVDTIVRSIIGVTMYVVMLIWWIRRRDRWRVGFGRFKAAARAARGV